MTEDNAKFITGYCVPWSLRAGEPIALHGSSHRPGPAVVELVRLSCGDPTKSGPGFREEPAEGIDAIEVELADQPLHPGSWGSIPLPGLEATNRLIWSFALRATRPAEPQHIAALGPLSVGLGDTGELQIGAKSSTATLREQPLDPRRWYRIEIAFDCATGTLSATASTADSASPGRDAIEGRIDRVSIAATPGPVTFGQMLLGAHADDVPRFDGRIGEISLTIDGESHRWDLARAMESRRIVEATEHGLDGELYQLPTRAITGPSWDGSEQRYRDAPDHYDAVHFHKDDLYDARWDVTTAIDLPTDLASGIYCFRITQGDEVDRVPFFVRPAVDAPTKDVALLMSNASYLAYANHRVLIDGADFIQGRSRLRPEHEYVRDHVEVGLSMYEKHPDRSGVMFSSRLRPVLNLRPGADGWNFTPDTDLNAWLEWSGVGHDVIGDEDIHEDGLAALSPYRVIVTGTHPEYWSTRMLDALCEWQRQGGRLMYLGGNGFYWRVAFSDDWPGAMELRRAEDGVRNWQTEDGESYHAWGGEYGGMWRRNGRPPNEVCGIGFAAQGFVKATHYDVADDSMAGRAAWIWDGVDIDDGRIGTSGLGGGAAGQEVDRYDTRLGSPSHAVVLASATDFGPDMVRTKEEFEGSVEYPKPDPYVRADIVFYETAGGGAVFSVGSISWFASLARNGYDNDTARMTTNVLRRFADERPFELPEHT
ncbi:MAG: N,N-dimethylformamidase beta subunit family domain-containing protein [Actinomycetota bacterium]